MNFQGSGVARKGAKPARLYNAKMKASRVARSLFMCRRFPIFFAMRLDIL